MLTKNLAPFIAMEYIDGKPLSGMWRTYSDTEKTTVAHNIAELTVRLGEQRFPVIGGMTSSGEQGPTVEGAKLFKGRNAFHDPACYDIGPYSSVRQYILACYDKETYYHSHAGSDVLDMDLFDTTTPAEFVKQLQATRAAVEDKLDTAPVEDDKPDEPFVLCHEDLQARNILMRGTDIISVIDWEFAGSYPLSELVNDGFDVLEYELSDDGEATQAECFRWSATIMSMVEQVARERFWKAEEIELLVRGGNKLLQAARVEMVPDE